MYVGDSKHCCQSLRGLVTFHTLMKEDEIQIKEMKEIRVGATVFWRMNVGNRKTES